MSGVGRLPMNDWAKDVAHPEGCPGGPRRCPGGCRPIPNRIEILERRFGVKARERLLTAAEQVA